MAGEPYLERSAESFDNNEEIWPEYDLWHRYTRTRIEKFLAKHEDSIRNAELVINAGSSGESYGFDDSKQLHVDLVKHRIAHKPMHVVASVEKLPLDNSSADTILCLGSVLNYTDPFVVIKEFSRVIKQGGTLFIEFECSNTLELLFSKKFNANATLVRTFYRSKEETIWYFSEKWISGILRSYGFQIVDSDRWHIFSPFVYKLTGNDTFSSRFAVLDSLLNRIPLVNKCCSNIILSCTRINP